MTISELGSLGELIGATATVATLIYLALQIRANTRATKGQALNDIIDRVIRWEARLVSTPELMHSWTEGTKSYHDLNLDAKLRFSSLSIEILAACEITLEAAKFGGVKPESVVAVRGIIHQLLRNRGVQECWAVNASKTMADDFVEEVNAILESSKSADPQVPGPLPFHMPALEF